RLGGQFRLDARGLAQSLQRARTFYQLARQRDIPYADISLARIRAGSGGVAAVVVGGLHAPAILHGFRQRGLSYIVVTPQLAIPTEAERCRSMRLAEAYI
ncbi:MAG: hypothetical protein WCG78_07965, partial [Candidatus Omnitrophota bacterium]